MLLAIKFLLFDRNDFVARQVADLDLLTVIDVFRMAFAIELVFFYRDNFIRRQVANLDVLVFKDCYCPHRISTVLDHCSDEFAIAVKPREHLKVIVDEAILHIKLVIRMAINCICAIR